MGLGWVCPHSAFSLSPPGVSMGNACPSTLFPTAASARMGTRGHCATRPGPWQSPAEACSACMATARPQAPRGHTVCVTPAFRASCVSKVRGPPPDVPSPGSPTNCFSNLTLSSSQSRQPFCPPPALVPWATMGLSESLHPLGTAPNLSWPSLPCSSLIQGMRLFWLGSLLAEETTQGNSSWPNLCILAPSPHDLGAAAGSPRVGDSFPGPPWPA